MKVSKAQIINAALSYVEEEIIPHIKDGGTKVILGTGVFMMRVNPKIADPVFNNSILKIAFDEDGKGMYDLDLAFDSLEKAIEAYGALPLNIPHVPLLIDDGQSLSFNVKDIENIRKRIVEGNE